MKENFEFFHEKDDVESAIAFCFFLSTRACCSFFESWRSLEWSRCLLINWCGCDVGWIERREWSLEDSSKPES